MLENVENNAKRNIADEIFTTSRFKASFSSDKFLGFDVCNVDLR